MGSSTIRLRCGSTVARSPGNSSVVASSCSITAGPAIVSPGSKRGAIVDRRVLRGIGREPDGAMRCGLGLAALARLARPRRGLAQLADRQQAEVHDLDPVGRIVEAVGALVLGEEALRDRVGARAADRHCRARSRARNSARHSARRARYRCCGSPARRLRCRTRRPPAPSARRCAPPRPPCSASFSGVTAVRTKVSRRSDTISPCAHRMPGANGTRQRVMPRLFATSVACSGPAPPNGSSAKARGSCPRSTETERIARTMLATTMPSMPCAVRSTEKPSRSASGAIALRARLSSSAMSPPSRPRGDSRPSTRLASVTVAVCATAAVAGRARLRARALRADLHQPVAVEPGDRAAAGADRVDVERGEPRRIALDPFVEGRAGGVVAHQRDVRAGAAHVERDHVRHAGEPRHVDRADRAGRRPRQRGADRHVARARNRHQPAGRLVDAERGLRRGRADAGREVAEIAVDHRLQIGVEHRGREPLVFAEFRLHLGRDREVHVRISGARARRGSSPHARD